MMPPPIATGTILEVSSMLRNSIIQPEMVKRFSFPKTKNIVNGLSFSHKEEF